MKKKILVATSYAAVAALAIGGTMAYFTATDEAVELAEDFKAELHKTHPLESNVLVPNCIYRAGCPEFQCCGYIGKFIKWAKDNNKEINWLNIQSRYDLYNEFFYSTREETIE